MKNHNMSHNVCSVCFCGKSYRLPKYSIGESVLYHGRICLVNGIYCPSCGTVVYRLESGDGSLPVEIYEHDLISSGNVPSDKLETYCGFRVGDTVIDKGLLILRVYVVRGFNYKRKSIIVGVQGYKWNYLVSPDDLEFINPVTLKVSKDRSILNEKENNSRNS